MAGETRVTDLIMSIRQGDLILPEFQRGYVSRPCPRARPSGT